MNKPNIAAPILEAATKKTQLNIDSPGATPTILEPSSESATEKVQFSANFSMPIISGISELVSKNAQLNTDYYDATPTISKALLEPVDERAQLNILSPAVMPTMGTDSVSLINTSLLRQSLFIQHSHGVTDIILGTCTVEI